jgi:hypothetical protein
MNNQGLVTGLAELKTLLDDTSKKLTSLSNAVSAFYQAQQTAVNAATTNLTNALNAHKAKGLGEAHLQLVNATLVDSYNLPLCNLAVQVVTGNGTYLVPAREA